MYASCGNWTQVPMIKWQKTEKIKKIKKVTSNHHQSRAKTKYRQKQKNRQKNSLPQQTPFTI